MRTRTPPEPTTQTAERAGGASLIIKYSEEKGEEGSSYTSCCCCLVAALLARSLAFSIAASAVSFAFSLASLAVSTSVLEGASPCSLAKMYSKPFIVLVTLLLNRARPNSWQKKKEHGRAAQ